MGTFSASSDTFNKNNLLINDFIDTKFKDSSPTDTVDKIKHILNTYDIKTNEKWKDTGVPYCFTVFVTVCGTNFTVTGKGLSKELALASGYGELMERLQMGYVGSLEVQKGGNHGSQEPSDVLISTEKLLAYQERYEVLSNLFHKFTYNSISPNQIINQFANKDKKVLSTPFYNITTGQKDYIPSILRRRVYTSNGCAAGNTTEEALVQAISEIVERHNQLEILKNNLTPPDIPEDVLVKFKVSYQIITYVRNQGYRVIIKDCSLGKKFPVIAVCYIDNNTGKYHTHFGAYPILEIALERALTESFQARNIGNAADYLDFSYNKNDIYDIGNLTTEFQRGCCEKNPSFFFGNTSYEYNEKLGFLGSNNKELLTESIDFFKEQGYEILARDKSTLGFPACQVIIPGYSEHYIYRMNISNDSHRFFDYSIRALRNPSTATIEDYIGMFKHQKEMMNFHRNTIDTHGFLAASNISSNISKNKEKQLYAFSLAYIYYNMGKYKDVVNCINNVLITKDIPDEDFLICLKRYLSLLLNGYNKNNVINIIQYFHKKQTVDRILTLSNSNPFSDYVLYCDKEKCNSCIISNNCYQPYTDKLIQLINYKAEEITYEISTSRILTALTK